MGIVTIIVIIVILAITLLKSKKLIMIVGSIKENITLEKEFL